MTLLGPKWDCISPFSVTLDGSLPHCRTHRTFPSHLPPLYSLSAPATPGSFLSGNSPVQFPLPSAFPMDYSLTSFRPLLDCHLLSDNPLWDDISFYLIISSQGENIWGKMRFIPWSRKVITVIIIGALKLIMWPTVTRLLKANATDLCTIKETGWVDARCHFQIWHTQNYWALILKSF